MRIFNIFVFHLFSFRYVCNACMWVCIRCDRCKMHINHLFEWIVISFKPTSYLSVRISHAREIFFFFHSLSPSLSLSFSLCINILNAPHHNANNTHTHFLKVYASWLTSLFIFQHSIICTPTQKMSTQNESDKYHIKSHNIVVFLLYCPGCFYGLCVSVRLYDKP